MKDAEIISRVMGGEKRLFGELVKRYAGCVWAICSSYVVNPSEREDLVQDVFVKSYLRLDTLRRPGAFGGWVTQIARRECLNWVRATARRRTALEQYGEALREEEAQGAGDIGDALLREDVRAMVNRLVETLPSKTREAMPVTRLERCSAPGVVMTWGESFHYKP